MLLTKEQRELDFRQELEALCGKHGAEIEITDDGRSYGFHSGLCNITMRSIYENDELIAEYCDFNL